MSIKTGLDSPAAEPQPHAKRARAGVRRQATEPTRAKLMRAARLEFAQHGFAGARVEHILSEAGVNPRMLYHHFSGKAGLYVAVLEAALGELRREELKLDVERADPLDGLLQLFDFLNDHFEANPELVRLLSNENLLEARFMRCSGSIREMSSPTLAMIDRLLKRGASSGRLVCSFDALRLYVLMVALAQFHLSNAHTLSVIFDQDLTEQSWRDLRRADARLMLRRFLLPGEAEESARLRGDPPSAATGNPGT